MISASNVSVSIIGASGYTGGELLRYLHYHSQIEVTQITSRQQIGQYVYNVHPHLRGVSDLKFIAPERIEPCDVLFLALPHGVTAKNIEHYATLAPKIIDLSADFRLNSADAYQQWYGEQHPAPDWLDRFVYGLPEVNRQQLRGADYASGVGCNATTVNLALRPLVEAGWLHMAAAELKVGSSEAGNQHSAGSHHPVRSGAVRAYSPTGHRHHAEVQMILGTESPIHFAVTAIEMVRGVHLLAHCYLNEPITQKDLWKLYRSAYSDEPFIRLVSAKTGLHRLPEPRLVAGTNYCDIGFELDSDGRHLVIVASLDNLGKGAAGSAVQCMNLMLDLNECDGLQTIGVYP